MQFNVRQIQSLIAEHEERFGSDSSVDSTNASLHGRIEWRTKMYAGEMPPVLPKPYEKGFKYQSDALRQKNVKLKSRLKENPFRILGEPAAPTATQKKRADTAAIIFNQGMDLAQKRSGIDLISALADGQTRLCYGVLHWCLDPKAIPEPPEREYVSELPGDPGEAMRYEEVEDEEERAKGNYRTTSADILDRHKRNIATAGWPWIYEVVPPSQFMFTPDRSMRNGLGICIVRREIGRLDYEDKRESMGKAKLSLEEQNPNIPVGQEMDAPPMSAPDAGRWKERIKVYQVWTRKEYYEYVEGEAECRESFEHEYGMAPFSIAYANINENETSLARRYEPALEGIYRIKPAFDYWMSLYYTMAESNAMPLYVLVSTGDGMPMLGDDGSPLVLNRNAAASMKIPDGYKLEKFENDINPGFARLGEWLLQELEGAYPSAGDAEVSASTQPWAIRLQQAMANVEPKMYLDEIVKAIDVCVQNKAYVMSNTRLFQEPFAVYARVKDGKSDRREIVSIEPEEIPSVDFTVRINNTSQAEQITREQFGMEKLAQRLITPIEFISEFEGKPDGFSTWVERMGFWEWHDKIMPGQLLRKEAEHFGGKFVMDPTTGGFISPEGASVSPEQVLQSNGIQPQRPPQGPPGAAPTMPSLPGVAAPGTMPLAGMRG